MAFFNKKKYKKPERHGKPLSISELVDLSPKLKRMGALDDSRQLDILKNWEDLVGNTVAKHSVPLRFRKGVLTVAVSSSAWMQELSLLKMKFMENMEKRFGKGLVTDIRFTPSGFKNRPSS